MTPFALACACNVEVIELADRSFLLCGPYFGCTSRGGVRNIVSAIALWAAHCRVYVARSRVFGVFDSPHILELKK